MQGASSAHTYALKPSDAAKLNQADIFFRMSETMEPFTAKVAKSLPKRVQVVTLQETPGLKLLPRRTGATFEDELTTATGQAMAMATGTRTAPSTAMPGSIRSTPS